MQLVSLTLNQSSLSRGRRVNFPRHSHAAGAWPVLVARMIRNCFQFAGGAGEQPRLRGVRNDGQVWADHQQGESLVCSGITLRGRRLLKLRRFSFGSCTSVPEVSAVCYRVGSARQLGLERTPVVPRAGVAILDRTRAGRDDGRPCVRGCRMSRSQRAGPGRPGVFGNSSLEVRTYSGFRPDSPLIDITGM